MKVEYSESDDTIWMRLISVWSYLNKITKTKQYDTEIVYNTKSQRWIVKITDNGS